MKKAVCLVAMLAFVAVANADVEFFFTHGDGAWGLDPAGHPYVGVPADPFVPSSGTGADYYYGYVLKNDATPLTAVPRALSQSTLRKGAPNFGGMHSASMPIAVR